MLAASQDCKAGVAEAGKAGDGGHRGGVVLEGRPQRALHATIGTWDSILGNTESKQRLLGRGVTGSDEHFKISHWLLCGEYTWGVWEQTKD